ncbi:hypothetical protein [Microbacterium saperdae]|uniref:Uncharacterized protein n=1 Tax=Microbacterium saperdae TaxID=69368 RepID=A0A543BJ88_9MICO|nr:hypothetical protein [Microbacterium saperdae]TQL84897.1 hypothetical protein FB560_0490 [Microbacterium saperdae]GGM58562.1 hypothetical protein GCM10010489_32760 [Microbacterium saperdae]
MTPTQHGTAVTTFLTREADTSLTAPLDDEHLAAEIHATLSVAAGTGTAYTTADALLAEAEAKPAGLRRRLLRLARLHALRADR